MQCKALPFHRSLLYIKTIFLPRQARDKHRKNTKNEWRRTHRSPRCLAQRTCSNRFLLLGAFPTVYSSRACLGKKIVLFSKKWTSKTQFLTGCDRAPGVRPPRAWRPSLCCYCPSSTRPALQNSPAGTTFVNVPYACPEPVLPNIRFSSLMMQCKMAKKTFPHRCRGRSRRHDGLDPGRHGEILR